MTKLFEYLGMDVGVMTTNDWLGVFFALVSAVGMVAVYFMVFRPSNKESFEAQGNLALDDEDHINVGEKR